MALTPGGALEILVGPTTLAQPGASAQLFQANGGVYFPSLFSLDGRIRLTSPVQRIDHVVAGSYTLVVAGGGSREVDIREGARSSVSLP